MADTVFDIIKALQGQLESEGFTLYSLRHQDSQPTLIMFNTKKKQFTIISFSPDTPGDYSTVNVWLTIAESKAEAFNKTSLASYQVFKDGRQMWQIGPGEPTGRYTDA